MKTKTRRTPRLERLESRDVPATFGIPWTNPQHLTVSFVPDGTDIHHRQSDLFKSLKQQGLQQADWQATVLRAIQTWAVNANINVGLVQEKGSVDLGADGAEQGDSRFGDIRIAGVNLGADSNQLAITTPHDPCAGTLAGDIIVNTGHNFGTGQGTRFDLYMVMLQEIGHALGLGNSTDRASVMYETYQGTHGLADSDITSIRALYGVRFDDRFEGSNGNDTFATALSFSPAKGALEADITTNQDADVYKFSASGKAKQATVQVSTAGLSLLNARVTVYDDNQQVLGSATADGPGDDLSVKVAVQSGGRYYVKVTGTSGDVFGTGSYQLKVALEGSKTSDDVTSGLIAADDFGADSDSHGGRSVYNFDSGVAQSGPTTVLTLTSTRSQVVKLDVRSNSRLAGGTVTIRDAAGKVVATLNAKGGANARVFVLLKAGTYTIQLDARPDRNKTGEAICYSIGLKVVSDPIDAYVEDPTGDPVGGDGGSGGDGSGGDGSGDGGSDGSSGDNGLDVTVLQPISRSWGPG